MRAVVAVLAGTSLLVGGCTRSEDDGGSQRMALVDESDGLFPALNRDAADMAMPTYAPAPITVTGSRVASPGSLPEVNRERYGDNEVAGVQRVSDAPVSTFGVDVDTGSYANVRRMLASGEQPPQDAVRTEELLNYLRYDYPAPAGRRVPFTVSTDVAVTP